MKGQSSISGRGLLLVFVVAAAIGVGLVVFNYAELGRPVHTTKMEGSLYVSDAGQASGALAHAATYNATLDAAGGSGTLNLTLETGPGDVLQRHVYNVSGFSVNDTSVSMLLDGQPVRLVWTANDSVWGGEFNNSFIASWGSVAPPNEVRGLISPVLFPGLASQYYVELRLTGAPQPAQPSF